MDSADCETEEDSAPEACVSPEGPQLPSNSREMRNKAEKMRRDKLNSFIGELATLVPMVARSNKRLDKTSILRLTATHLRIYQTLLNGKSRPHMELPKHVDQYILEQLVCDQLGGFLLILTPNGKIVFVSHTVENLLGHVQADLMGQSIFNVAAPDDHDRIRTYISPDSCVDGEWKKYFTIKLKRSGPRTELPVYEPVKFMGVHRSGTSWSNNIPENNQSLPTSSSSNTTCSSSSSSSTSTSTIANSYSSNDVLLFFVRIFRPEPLTERLLEACKDEYVTRHLIDGRIINCDQRISIIAGYMSEEVSGLSAFKFMHREDVRWVMIALRQMYDRGESKGSSCYRLLSRNGQFIYLRTFGYLEIDDQGIVESFVCVNTLVDENVGLQLIREMKKRFSALINNTKCGGGSGTLISSVNNSTAVDSNMQTVEDPQQIEEAVVHLITDLPSPGSDQCSTPSPRNSCNNSVNNYLIENQDCTTTTTTEIINSPKKAHHVKLKTAVKRPLRTDLDNNIYKRQRTSIQQKLSTPYHKRPQIQDITQHQQSEHGLYQQDSKFLHHNI